ncbi:ribonuclease III [Aristophania vespae]|uniref:Ribonuclease 3 n=1 Tax=Aristophania vespae TaxID=2697033 RepID=A0A6P1NCW7_9PROT|nr:ribonuclease III [Aristophania vespae]QHI95333.1 ribonuclease III [Aristophania vespae]UMM64595.1 Ribonuclease 3 [Aristophania vespae]
MDYNEKIIALQKRLGHVFIHSSLLQEALTHRSALVRRTSRRAKRVVQEQHFGRASQNSNERLEFIGDRVLGLVVAEWLFERFPKEQEGALGARHAHLVSRPVLAAIAEKIGLSEALLIAQHEENAGIRELASVKADAMEAILGALYLDAGLEKVKKLIHRFWKNEIDREKTPHKEPKTLLQEYVLGKGNDLPRYELLSSEGPSHAPIFRVEVTALNHVGKGEAKSKRLAESAAAVDLLKKLGQETKSV